MDLIEDMMTMDFLGIRLCTGTPHHSSIHLTLCLLCSLQLRWLYTAVYLKKAESQLESSINAGLLLRSNKLLKARLMTKVGKRLCK